MDREALEELKKLIPPINRMRWAEPFQTIIEAAPKLIAEVELTRQWLDDHAQHEDWCKVFGNTDEPCSCGLADLFALQSGGSNAK